MLIFLIGFMGCGKSRMGRKLSAKMNLHMEDMDKVIEEKVGMSVPEFFEKNGEEAFRKLENEYLINLDPNQDLIVSTGGGVPCFFDNMDIMNEKGITIFLNSPIEKILERVKRNPQKRPLLKPLFDKPEEEFDAVIKERLKARMPFYSRADFMIKDNKVSKMVKFIKEEQKKEKEKAKEKPKAKKEVKKIGKEQNGKKGKK